MRSLVLPETLDSIAYEDLVSKVKNHKEPAPSVIVRRFQFNTRNQKPSESISEYIAVLRKAAEHCNYGESLSEMLRDRLVCGITNSAVQKRLLAEKELTLERAVSLAQAVEIAEKGSKDLHAPPTGKTTTTPDADLFKVNPGVPKKAEDKTFDALKKCYRCGGKHLASQCRFKSEQCHICHKRGHIARVCQSKRAQTARNSQPVHNITDTSLDGEYQLFVVHTHSNKPLKTTLLVEGQELTMEIDTGAGVSLVSEETVSSSFMKYLPLYPTDVRLRTYTGEAVPVLGKLMVSVVKDEASITLPLLVVKGGGTTLLGRDWLQQLRLDWKTIFSLHSTLNLQQVLDYHIY